MSRSSAAYHHGDLAEALVRAATALVDERGSSAVSLREVARQAGVSHNAPYHHFQDRGDLLKAVAARGMRTLLDAMEAGARRGVTPQARLVGIGQAYVDFAVDHPGIFGVMFDPSVCDPRDPNPVTGPLAQANDDFLAAAVRETMPQASEDEVNAAAAGRWGSVHGLAVLVAGGFLERAVVPAALASLFDA